jgi:CPA2 family monovalent cation:H+ antiporter-2
MLPWPRNLDMTTLPEDFSADCPFDGHAIIAGFGVPGRAVGELLADRNVPYCVIELNPRTVDRCAGTGIHMIAGDVRDEQVLRRAGIERAALFAIAIPNEPAVLEAVRLARLINPRIHIMARCHFISAGMEAHRRGANEVVIEEQVVGEEFVRLLKEGIAPLPTHVAATQAP